MAIVQGHVWGPHWGVGGNCWQFGGLYNFWGGVGQSLAVESFPSALRGTVGLLGSTTASAPFYRHQGALGGAPGEQERPIGFGAFGVVWAVSDPNSDRRIALKKLPRVFQSLMSARRAYRELKALCSLKHDNVLSAMDILIPSDAALHGDIYIATELMQSDLHRIIVSSQPITIDHIKVFIYQILRGLKYIHSAHILHRDIKPGNILVNANCCLKICDFGLARVEAPDEGLTLTHEVVTQYYRAPEILMGARHYTAAVDVWAVGCILAELLSRRILFQAKSPVQQLELILALLGTPSAHDMRDACAAARTYVHRQPPCAPNPAMLYALSKDSGHEVVHLLCQLLVFNPERRLSAANALSHPYLDEGRLRYHTFMCTCADHQFTGAGGLRGDESPLEEELDPLCLTPFSLDFEDELNNVFTVRDKIYQLCYEMERNSERSLYINTNSSLYSKLASSQCAQPSEASTPQAWE